MADKVFGINFQADVSDLKSGLAEAKKAISDASLQFKASTAALDNWQKSADGVAAKVEQLGAKLSAQKSVVSAYEQEIERLKQAEGDHTKEIENLSKKLLAAKTDVAATTKQLDNYQKKLAQVSSESNKFATTLEKQKSAVKDAEAAYKSAVLQYGKFSKEAQAAGAKLQSLSAELSKSEKKNKDLAKSIDELKNSATVYQKIQNAATAMGKAQEAVAATFKKVALGAAGLIGSLTAVAEKTRDYREQSVRMATAFTSMGKSADDASAAFAEFFKVSGDASSAAQATQYIAAIANGEQDIAKWSDIAAGAAGRFGNSLPIDALAESAAKAAAAGEVEGKLKDALDLSGASAEGFKTMLAECSSEQERSALVTDTLNGLFAESAAAYRDNNAAIMEQNAAQQSLNESLAAIGAAFEPVLAQVKTLSAELTAKLVPFIQDALPKLSANMNEVVGVASVAVGVFGAFKVAALATAAATKAVAAAEKVRATAHAAAAAAAALAQKAQVALNLVMTANPIGLVVAAIGALVIAFKTLWDKCEAFRNFWIGLWENVIGVFNGFLNKFKKLLGGIGDKIFKKLGVESGQKFSQGLDQSTKKSGEVVAKNIATSANEIKAATFKAAEAAGGAVNTVVDKSVKGIGKISAAGKESARTWQDVAAQILNVDLSGITNGIAAVERYRRAVEKTLEQEIALAESRGETFDVAKFYENAAKSIAEFQSRLQESGEFSVDDNIQRALGELSKAFKAQAADAAAEGKQVSEALANSAQQAADESERGFVGFVNAISKKFSGSIKEWQNGLGGALGAVAAAGQKAMSYVSSLTSAVTSFTGQESNQAIAALDREFDEYEEAADNAIEVARERAEQEQEILQEKYDAGVISKEAYDAAVDASEARLRENEKAREAEVSAAQEALNRKKNALAEKQFNAEKGTNIAMATINAALAITKAIAELGPIAGPIAAGVIGATTAVQIATIARQQYVPFMAKGGIVDEPTLAVVGEAGKEAVMPLENNTGWISELAVQISKSMKSSLKADFESVAAACATRVSKNDNRSLVFNQTITTAAPLAPLTSWRAARRLITQKGGNAYV